MEESQKKYVVLCLDNNPDYIFYAPYCEKAWNKYGWDICVMITDDVNESDLKLINPNSKVFKLPKIDSGMRSPSVAMSGRLCAANYLPQDALLMTSDIDLIPLQDYWKPNIDEITVYGHDLTWFSFYPMGYIAMSGANWTKYIGLTGDTESDILRNSKDPLVKHSPYSEDWEAWWNFDWDFTTTRLKPHADKITFINRGQINIAGTTLALGRVDRYNWTETQKQETFIDMHCENISTTHEEKLPKFLEVYERFHGKL